MPANTQRFFGLSNSGSLSKNYDGYCGTSHKCTDRKSAENADSHTAYNFGTCSKDQLADPLQLELKAMCNNFSRTN